MLYLLLFIMCTLVAFILGYVIGQFQANRSAYDNIKEVTYFHPMTLELSQWQERIKVVTMEWFRKHMDDYRLYLQSKSHWYNPATEVKKNVQIN